MYLTSTEFRDNLAEGIADVVGWLVPGFLRLFTDGWFALGAFGGALFLLIAWRASLALGPMKKCWRCGGEGHVGGLFGGRKTCPHCDGGLRPRIGSGGNR